MERLALIPVNQTGHATGRPLPAGAVRAPPDLSTVAGFLNIEYVLEVTMHVAEQLVQICGEREQAGGRRGAGRRAARLPLRHVAVSALMLDLPPPAFSLGLPAADTVMHASTALTSLGGWALGSLSTHLIDAATMKWGLFMKDVSWPALRSCGHNSPTAAQQSASAPAERPLSQPPMLCSLSLSRPLATSCWKRGCFKSRRRRRRKRQRRPGSTRSCSTCQRTTACTWTGGCSAFRWRWRRCCRRRARPPTTWQRRACSLPLRHSSCPATASRPSSCCTCAGPVRWQAV